MTHSDPTPGVVIWPGEAAPEAPDVIVERDASRIPSSQDVVSSLDTVVGSETE